MTGSTILAQKSKTKTKYSAGFSLIYYALQKKDEFLCLEAMQNRQAFVSGIFYSNPAVCHGNLAWCGIGLIGITQPERGAADMIIKTKMNFATISDNASFSLPSSFCPFRACDHGGNLTHIPPTSLTRPIYYTGASHCAPIMAV